MPSSSKVTSPGRPKPAKNITRVLNQTAEAKELVDEVALELPVVNAALKQERNAQDSPPEFGQALEKSEEVEEKVQEAADKLKTVTEALKNEVRERHVLEIQLAAITEREDASRQAALHDALTSLPNRILFYDRLEHGLAQAKRHGWNLAVMFIDLDAFKQINDLYGHDAGDSVLKTVATRLSAMTRDVDTIGRQGGDEFLYLLAEVNSEQDLGAIAEKMVAAIQLPCDVQIGDIVLPRSISASIGIALYPQDGTTANALVKSADKAMYQAKGSDTRYAFASPAEALRHL